MFILHFNAKWLSVQVKSSGSSPTLQSRTVTPSSSTRYITADSGYDGLSQVTVYGDSNLVSSNIKSGVSIFGVSGSLSVSKVEAHTRDNTGSMNTISFTVEHPEYFTNGNVYLQVIDPYLFQDGCPIIVTSSWE